MRGQRFHALLGTRVGNAVYHSVGDREDAIRQLGIDYDQAYADIGHAIGVLPIDGSAARVAAHGPKGALWFTWWQSVERPLMAAWTKFKAEQLGGDTTGPGGSWIAYANRWQTPWSEIETYRRRLVDFRDGARRLGIPLTSPPPVSLPTTTVEDASQVVKDLANKAKDAAAATFDLTKILIYGGLAVGGAVAVTALVANVRSNKDPIVEWRKR